MCKILIRGGRVGRIGSFSEYALSYVMMKEENYNAALVNINKLTYLDQLEGEPKRYEMINRLSDVALANMLPWYGERLRIREENRKKRLEVEINAVDRFEEVMAELE